MPGILCEHCTGYCCRYIALPIDEPDGKKDFDDIRWYLLHEGVAVFVEDGEWFINIQTTCRHLQPDYRCGIYETRPQICRDYSTDNCDYHSGDYGWEQHFTAPEHLDEYMQMHAAEKRLKAAAKRDARKTRDKDKHKQKMRAGLKVRLRRKARQLASGYVTAEKDITGTPLPQLRL